MRRNPVFLFFILLIIALSCCNRDQVVVPAEIDFNLHIRPILSGKCYACHGPDADGRESDLRLDTEKGIQAVLKSGNRAVVPGRPGSSELIHRITSKDETVVMPPPASKKTLTKEEIAILNQWIRQGAEWKPHWAFVPMQKPKVPQAVFPELTNNEIDHFIQAKWDLRGLSGVPVAEKATLVRRLYFTLVGLPPSPEAVAEFEGDLSESSYEKLVDDLLASPHFGEKWARHWMDLVRFSETKGHEFDYPVNGAWRYRDYLIRAFNADLPYDNFVREHLAGDLLAPPRYHPQAGFNESVIGTAHFALGEGKHSPVDIRKEEADVIDNIIDVTTKTFQALTVGCARCHDHKFDPIPTTDYYSLYGIMESSRWNIYSASTSLQKLRSLDTIHQLKAEIKEWIASANGVKNTRPAQAKPVNYTDKRPASGPDKSSDYEFLGDFRDGGLAGWSKSGIAFENALGNPILKGDQVLAFEKGKVSSKVNGKGLQGALRSPTFKIDDFDHIMVRAAGKKALLRIIIDNFQLIQNPIYGELDEELNSEVMKDISIDLSPWKGHKAYVEFLNGTFDRHAFEIPPDSWLEAAYVVRYRGNPPEIIQPNELDNKDAAAPSKLLTALVENKISDSGVARLNEFISGGNLRTGLPKLETTTELKRLRQQLYDSTFFIGLAAGDAILSSVFLRGNHLKPDQNPVPHRYFANIDLPDFDFDTYANSRLALAEAFVHPQNPLTARVMVNRIWHHLFGKGIVETVDNFGLQGKPPTHPKLLDHLAVRFMEQGWSIKKLIKYIVLSHTFRQSATALPENLEVDSENRYLHHYPLRRLEAESIRDAMLCISATMDSTMFGPSVPVHLTEFMNGRGRPQVSGPLDGAGRRTIYLSVRRNFLSPLLLTFDFPVPFSTFGKRNVTNVPAQSLTLMNDPFVAAQAASWADRLISQKSEKQSRIRLAYQVAFSRDPSPKEIEEAEQFLSAQAVNYRQKTGEEAIERKVWIDFCHAIFNMKEFIYFK